jgi:hypothetical protein
MTDVERTAGLPARFIDDLTLRSGPQDRVSKGRSQSWCCPPFETRAARAPQGEVGVDPSGDEKLE